MKQLLWVITFIFISLCSAWSGDYEDYKKLAEQGDATSQYALGIMYQFGKGVGEDQSQAINWFLKAAQQGHALAQSSLGHIYYSGIDVPKDYEKAKKWYSKAAEQGDFWAQWDLGNMYFAGHGGPMSYNQALYWYTKSAMQGFGNAQIQLGSMYYMGKGVPQNYKLAYAWYNLAASQGWKEGVEKRELISEKLTSQKLAEAQELSVTIQHHIDNPSDSNSFDPPTANTEKAIIGSGTGFIVTRDGFILTCHHVIKDASRVQIVSNGNTFPAKIIRDDPYNDLALLKIDGSFSAIAFSQERYAKMGQEVFTIGYPNPAMQGMSAKFTEGTISSLTGFQDDLRLYQISVPVQPGNSGGALLDENGNVLGVIVAMLDAKTTFRVSGTLPQNVNYAIKSVYAQAMLDTIPEISNKLISPSSDKSDAVERVGNATVMILSYE